MLGRTCVLTAIVNGFHPPCAVLARSKTRLRLVQAWTVEALLEAIQQALDPVTRGTSVGWFTPGRLSRILMGRPLQGSPLPLLTRSRTQFAYA